MRSVSILELCLLAFPLPVHQCASAFFKDMAFGFGLGFGLMSANDLIFAALIPATLR